MSQIITREKPLERDDSIQLPAVDIISASAGSGKTYTMAMRLAQFLLSSKIPNNDLRHILAITFTNLAAKELKERLILTLKKLALKDKDTTDYFAEIISIPREKIPATAEQSLENVLARYSDLQVKTIDSFFTQMFRSSAHDYGLYADCDITFQPQNILENAFDELSKIIFKENPLANQFDRITNIISLHNQGNKKKFSWDPFDYIRNRVIHYYRSIKKQNKPIHYEDLSADIIETQKKLHEIATELLSIINNNDLSIKQYFKDKLTYVINKQFIKIIDTKIYSDIFKEDKKNDKDPALKVKITDLQKEFNEYSIKFVWLYVHNFFYPYISAYTELSAYLNQIQRNLDEVALDDLHQYITGTLSGMITSKEDIIASVYERLGETIHHYMIDEFQDTAPVHWNNLFPLIENALAGKGSLFVVGDTKQSMYAFNNADWRILKNLTEHIVFTSAEENYSISHLKDNYRSGGAIVEFNRHLFQEHIPNMYSGNHESEKKNVKVKKADKEKNAKQEEYKTALRASGLMNYIQNPLEKKENQGYVSVEIFPTVEDYKMKLVATINQLKEIGIPLKEIAVLARRNEDVIEISETLRTSGIDCVSYSSLDIRQQSLTAGIFSFLAFLDSPVDNLSFGRFLLNDIFVKVTGMNEEIVRDFIFRNRDTTLYTAFRKEHETLWNQYFDVLFKKTGFLTPYDMVSEIFTTFRLYENFMDESAALTKFLETVKEFEINGRGTLKEFLAISEDDKDDSWNILVSPDFNAVRAMTIHKSKGLTFGYVIAVFNDDHPSGDDRMYFAEKDDVLCALKINQNIATRVNEYFEFKKSESPEYKFIADLYESQKLTELVEWFNLRYVALTRPKHALFAFGVCRSAEKRAQNRESPTANPNTSEALKWLDVKEKTSGTLAKTDDQESRLSVTLPMKFPEKIGLQDNYTLHKIRNDERYRGDNIHFVLSKTETLTADTEKQLRVLAGNYALPRDYALTDADFRAMTGLLLMPEMRPYYEELPGRVIRNELDYIDSTGTHRIDRLVADPHEVTIIDYKTGETDDPVKYEKQIRAYMDFARAFYPGRSVKGILAYIDRQTIRVIS